MRVAVTSQNFRTVTGHAGRTRRFFVYEAGPDGEPIEVERLDLPKELALHEHSGAGSHPIDDVNTIVTAGCGQHFKARMAGRGIAVLVTGLQDPVAAARAAFKGEPMPAPEHDAGCSCACHAP